MRTFAQQQNQPQKPLSSSLARPDKAALPRLRTQGDEPDTGSIALASPRFSHDFSQMPVSARKPATAESGAANAPSSSSHPLDSTTRVTMEARFSHDFGHVRVHTDPMAASEAARLNARAFTINHDIHFGDTNASSTAPDDALLVHELTHVVQADVAASNPGQPADSADDLEHEARCVANAFRLGAAFPPVRGLARGLAAPLRDDGKPTFGNLPGDDPELTGSRRVRLQLADGKWQEISGGRTNPRRTATGSYDFVVIDGTIYAVKSNRFGHTEAARGGRVTWAGVIVFDKGGALKSWNNASGHYLPAGGFASNAANAHPDLPMDKYEQTYRGSHVDTTTGQRRGPQLPVYQPKEGETLEARGRGGDVKKQGSSKAEPVPQSTVVSGKYETKDELPPPKPPATPDVTKGKLTPPKVSSTASATPTRGKPGIGTTAGTSASADTAAAIARLDAEAAEAARFTGRIRTYVAAYGALQNAISLLDTIDAAEKIFFHGTVFEHEQSEADNVAAQSSEALQAAESSTAGNAYLGAIIDIGEARRNSDQQGLFALAASLTKLDLELSESAEKMSAVSSDIDAQAQAMLRAARNNKKAATQGMDDAAMAQAAALYISTEKLGNTLRGAAENYRSAAEMLNASSAAISSAASEAEEAAWALGYAHIIKAQQEIDRQQKAKPRPLTPMPRSASQSSFMSPRGSGPGGELTEEDKALLVKFIRGQ
jgi:hypothetical protein